MAALRGTTLRAAVAATAGAASWKNSEKRPLCFGGRDLRSNLHPHSPGAGRMQPTKVPAPPPSSSEADELDNLPLFRFGVIADVQYCDIPDGFNFTGTTRRHYRGSLATARKASEYWRRRRAELVCNLGDIIDGQCRDALAGNPGGGTSESALAAVLAALESGVGRDVPFVHLIGNHELYNFDRDALAAKLRTRRPRTDPAGLSPRSATNMANHSGATGEFNEKYGDAEFYAVRCCPGWRLVVLDPFQNAVIGSEEGSEAWSRSFEFLRSKNKNIQDANALKGGGWFEGLPRRLKNFVPYNGGFGEPQLRWLQEELSDADACGDRVVLLTHVIIHPAACDGSTMAWDYEKALRLCQGHPCVAAVLAGHDHKGGYHYSREVQS